MIASTRIRPTLIALAVGAALAGCAPPTIRPEIEAQDKAGRTALQSTREKVAESQSHYHEIEGPAISIRPLNKEKQAVSAREWLSAIRVTLDPAKDAPVSAPAILRVLRAKGLNITSSLPLDDYTYNGYGVTNVSADTALLVFLGSMGLDYEIDDTRRLVTVMPLKPRTWSINIGNRATTYTNGSTSSGTSTTGANTGTSASAMSPAGITSMGTGATANPYGTGTSGLSGTTSSSATPTTGSGGNTVSSTDNFWTNMRTELAARLTVLIPRRPGQGANAGTGQQPVVPALGNGGMPPAAQYGVGGAQGGTDGVAAENFYARQQIGVFALNPDTGAITVQAPRFILDAIDKYITDTQAMYDTLIVFDGELVSVTTDRNQSEGFDWQAFGTILGGGAKAVFQNNILGGAILSAVAGGTTALALGNPNNVPAPSSVFGAMSNTGNFSIFNAYMSSIGQMKVHEHPFAATTSGVPVNFGKTQVAYYQSYQQTAAAGTTGAATTATNTIDIPYATGLRIRINPRYDVSKGLVRAQISMWRQMVAGWDNKINVITAGSSIHNFTSRTPRLSTIDNDGEVLLRDGDLIVLGGLTEDNADTSDAGVTALQDSALHPFTGNTNRKNTMSSYYFALRVHTKKQ